MLRIEHLTKSFGGVVAVDDCSFHAAPKHITALIGPNGAGKTTAFHCITGVMPADQGMVMLNGRDCARFSASERARMGMSRTFQQVRLFPYLTVAEHILLALHTSDDRVRAIWSSDSDAQLQEVVPLLARVGLPEACAHQLGSDLSYGQSKLLEIARALAMPHTILLLDEPIAGVNPVLREHIAKLLNALRAEGESILLIEHDMDFVRTLADHVIVMAEGRVLLEGTPDDVLRHPDVLKAYLGSVSVPEKRVPVC
jgi:ABC-type branched-subunit amino acid transport system ATPase component